MIPAIGLTTPTALAPTFAAWAAIPAGAIKPADPPANSLAHLQKSPTDFTFSKPPNDIAH